MRILLMTYGTRGDVEPYLALAEGFVRAGHSARLAAPTTYANLAAAIDEAARDAFLRARCREIGQAIDAEDGVALAVDLVTRALYSAE